MRKLLAAIFLLAAAVPAFGQSFGNTTGYVIPTCGSPPIAYNAGNPGPFSLDTSGKLCVNATVVAEVEFPTIGAPVPSTGVYNGINVGGTLRGWSGLSTGSIYPGAVAIVDASGNQVTSFGGSNASVSATGSSVPASATYVGVNVGGDLTGWDGQVTANAGTNLNTSLLALESGGNLATLAGIVTSSRAAVNPIAGQSGVQGGSGNVSATTQRVVLAADVGLPAGANTIGTVNLGTLNGAATAANQTSVIGTKAPGTAATNSLLAGGVYTSGGITLSDGQQAALQFTSSGELIVTSSGGGGGGTSSNFGAAFPTAGTAVGMSDTTNMVPFTTTDGTSLNVSLTTALPAGSNTIGAVTQASGPWTVTGSGTAGTAASGVVSIQGIASMTPVQVSQATAGNLNATVVGTGTFLVQAAQSGTWNINDISGTISLPNGASTAANQTSVIGTKNAGSAAASSLLVGGVYNSSPLTLTTGQQASLQFDAAASLNVNCVTGCSGGGGGGGTSSNFGSAFPTAGTAAGMSDGSDMVPFTTTDGTSLDVAVIGTVAATQSGTWNINDITGTVSLPSGASTSAKQPALGTAGTASTDVITVQGIAAMTPLLVNGSGSTQPVSGTITANLGTLNGAATAANQILTNTPVAPNTATATAGVLLGGQYNSSQATFTNGQQGAVQMSSRGEVRIVNMDAAGNARGANVNASNQLAVTADVSAINGVTPLMGNGNTGTGSQRVTIAADNSPIAGAGVAATSGAVPANAGYQGVQTSAGLTGIIGCNNTAIYDASTSGSTQLVALTSTQVIYICGYTIVAGGTVNVKLVYGTGTNCASSPQNMLPAFQLTAQTGAVDGAAFYRGLKTAASNALCINTSAGVAVQAIVYYTKF